MSRNNSQVARLSFRGALMTTIVTEMFHYGIKTVTVFCLAKGFPS